MNTIVALIQLFAMACLAFSMGKHHKALSTKFPSLVINPRGLVVMGWLGVVLSLFVSTVTNPILSIALVWWFCTLSLAIFAIALLISHVTQLGKA